MDHPKLEALKKAWHEKRSVTMVYILLRTSVVLVMLAQIFNRNFEFVHAAQHLGAQAGP